MPNAATISTNLDPSGKIRKPFKKLQACSLVAYDCSLAEIFWGESISANP